MKNLRELVRPALVRLLAAAAWSTLVAGACLAGPVVEKVEPPSWWPGHTRNPIQVMLTGTDLKGAKITGDRDAFQIEVRHASDDGRYVFAYINISSKARPGKYRFGVATPTGSASFDFTLEPPIRSAGRFRGFGTDDVIYLLMPDRFSNGDPANDGIAGAQPSDRANGQAYHGGDFRGIQNHLDYLKDLGVTGIWMTPVYKNSSPVASPYHGYHTVDFYAVEPHFGSMRDLQRLVDAAHQQGLKIMLDQVPNHCGPAHPWLEAPPTPTWFHDFNVKPHGPSNDMAAITDPYARPRRRSLPLRAWFNGRLPDLDQADPLVRDYLIQNALWWIGETGADGFRIDTFARVDRPFWQEWNGAIKRQFPQFFTVGEVSGFRSPAAMASFQGGASHFGFDTKLDSELDFQLHRALRAVFVQNAPMSQLTDVLAQDFVYPRPDVLAPFLGNHDVTRFLSLPASSIPRLLLAEAFLLTTRGIPELYYGDEIAMGLGNQTPGRGADRADFPGGFPGDPVNAFRPEGRKGDAGLVFDFVRKLLLFRQAHPPLRGGSLTQLLVEENRYVYLRGSGKERVLVALDRSGASLQLEIDVTDLQIPDGTKFRSWDEGRPDSVVSNGKLIISHPGAISILWAILPD